MRRSPNRRVIGWVPAWAILISGAACRDPVATPRQAFKPAPVALPPPRTRPDFQKGVALGLYGDFFWMTQERALEEIGALGATHVSLVVSWQQGSIHSTRIRAAANPRLSDHRLVRLIRRARSLGLRVLLFPLVRIRYRLPKQWRGRLKPYKRHEWFKSYERFILHYAGIAARERVSILSVGSELATLEGDRGAWARLIASVRRVFTGKVLYSANWDHYRPVAFWDLVDYVGLSGYFELVRSEKPAFSELLRAWRRVRAQLRSWQRTIGKPIVFTEVGYYSREGTAREPWNYRRSAPVDLGEQRDCYRAFYETWNGSKILGGVYFWQWFGFGGPNDGHYTPRGKPAEGIVRHWFGRGAAR